MLPDGVDVNVDAGAGVDFFSGSCGFGALTFLTAISGGIPGMIRCCSTLAAGFAATAA